ncbi:MAG: serine hydrolase domain-containing protein, partial [Paraburkholderia sp.]|uniref:serine hydrolase domain-containing protein n=1 Tax=Paraburkholderia sp. TaxID=1926495 RepID=UPI003C400ACC
MRMLTIFATVALVVTGTSAMAQVASVARPPELTASDLETWLDGVVPYALERNDIAGALVVVVKDGRVLWEKGYGYADVVRKKPMDPERTLVEVASVTKTFTWTAVMQLVEQKKLDLDRDVNDYLDFKIPTAFGMPITLRNLMTHTAGFEERLKSYITVESPRDLGSYLQSVPVPTRIYAPGTVQAYSNYGAMLGGYIVERASGEPYARYIERHILAPLGMKHSFIARPVPAALRSDLAKNYEQASSREPIAPDAIQELATDPAGSLLSTADDMSRFMRAHLQRGHFEDYQMLTPEATELMHRTAFVPMPGAQGTALGLFGADYN